MALDRLVAPMLTIVVWQACVAQAILPCPPGFERPPPSIGSEQQLPCYAFSSGPATKAAAEALCMVCLPDLPIIAPTNLYLMTIPLIRRMRGAPAVVPGNARMPDHTS